MANRCITNYVFEGEKEEIQDFFAKLKSLETMPPLREDSANDWLGCALMLYDIDPEDIECRGYFFDAVISEGTVLLTTDTAWAPMHGVWNAIQEKYGTIGYVYLAEEPGIEYYATNDIEGKYFPDRYIVDAGSGGIEYFAYKKEMFEHVSELTGVSVKGMASMKRAIKEYNEAHEEEGGVYFNEIEIER